MSNSPTPPAEWQDATAIDIGAAAPRSNNVCLGGRQAQWRWRGSRSRVCAVPVIWGLLLTGLLSACGGGSGGGSQQSAQPPSSGSTPQVQNLKAAPAPQEPFNIPAVTMTTNLNGNNYTAIYSQTSNNGTTMFAGQAAHSSTISLIITENGSTISTEVSTTYYLESPYVPLGVSGTVGSTAYTFLFTSTDPLPSTLTVGGSGELGSGTYYVSGTNTAIGSLSETYSITDNSSSNLILITNSSGAVNGSSVNETITYFVASSGAVALDGVQLIVNGTELSFGTDPWSY